MKRNGETVEYQVTLNIPDLRKKINKTCANRPVSCVNGENPSDFGSDKETAYRCMAALGRRACPLRHRCARQGWVAAPSVCFAAARILLAAAPTAPPCFRHWRRSSPLPPKGEPLAKPFTLRGLPKPPLGRGGGTASAVTERLSPAAAHGQALS